MTQDNTAQHNTQYNTAQHNTQDNITQHNTQYTVQNWTTPYTGQNCPEQGTPGQGFLMSVDVLQVKSLVSDSFLKTLDTMVTEFTEVSTNAYCVYRWVVAHMCLCSKVSSIDEDFGVFVLSDQPWDQPVLQSLQ